MLPDDDQHGGGLTLVAVTGDRFGDVRCQVTACSTAIGEVDT
nr:hypothetical protein [Pseudonocardia sp. WMMC193]